MMKCEHCKSEACKYVDHGNGPDPAAASLAESLSRAARERVEFVTKYRERFLEAWIAETGLLPSDCVLVEASETSGQVVTTTISVRRRDGAEVTPNTLKAIERLERLVEKNDRLSRQRTVLRREVRRLNEKVAAMSAVLSRVPNSWTEVAYESARRVLSGNAMWELRKAAGLTACEVSSEDVLRAAARKLGKDGANG